LSIKRDATDPTISDSASPAAMNGWNNTSVTVSFACADNLSGVASCSPEAVLASEGRDQSVNGYANDEAGNTQSVAVGGLNIDKTAPSAPAVATRPGTRVRGRRRLVQGNSHTGVLCGR
jgi:hypothetical protein